MPTRHAWDDNNYERKALRRIFTKLLKRFEKEINNDDLELEIFQKIAYTLNNAIIEITISTIIKPMHIFTFLESAIVSVWKITS